MKNLVLTVMTVLMLAFGGLTTAMADPNCEGGRLNFGESIQMMDAMGVPHIVLTGESMKAFTDKIEEKTGVAAPEEIVAFIGPARGDVLADPLAKDVAILTYQADNCLYQNGVTELNVPLYIEALDAAGFGPAEPEA